MKVWAHSLVSPSHNNNSSDKSLLTRRTLWLLFLGKFNNFLSLCFYGSILEILVTPISGLFLHYLLIVVIQSRFVLFFFFGGYTHFELYLEHLCVMKLWFLLKSLLFLVTVEEQEFCLLIVSLYMTGITNRAPPQSPCLQILLWENLLLSLVQAKS